jgi:hypothetical protein
MGKRRSFLLPVILGLALALAAWGRIEASEKSPAAGSLRAVQSRAGCAVVFTPARGGGNRVLYRGEKPVNDACLDSLPEATLLAASWQEAGEHGGGRVVTMSLDGGIRWSRPQHLYFDLYLRTVAIATDGSSPPVPEGLAAGPTNNLYVVQFSIMSCAPLRERLKALGVELLTPVPEHAYIVRMSSSLAERVRLESFVRLVHPYHPAYRIDPALLEALAADGRDGAPERRYVLQTFTPGPEEKRLLAGDVASAGGRVVKMIPHGSLLEAVLRPAQVGSLVRSNHLMWIEAWQPDEDDMDIVREVSGVDFVESAAGFDGTGVAGEVLDSGIMQDHPDFTGISIHGPAPPVTAHGTCSYGIVFGSGSGDSKATGVLPHGTGWFAGRDQMTDRYQHTAELVSAPIFAVFQSNSWGSGRSISYNAWSAELDDIVFLYDISIFQSQSNEGNRYSRPQAWSKNVVSVGGVLHQDTAALADDRWSRSASIGPPEDGRIKPDLVHFYDWVYTTDLEPAGYAPGLYFASFGGTSASTPIVAGLGGLVIEMWAGNVFGTNPSGTTVFEKRPHASTTKALLINGAIPYPFTSAGDDLARMHQGWGLPSVRTLYERASRMKIIDETTALKDLEFASYLAHVPAGQAELRATLVYTDPAGVPFATVSRVNDLSLRVTAPDGTEYWGNNGLAAGNWSAPGGSSDARNTVENVFIQSPPEGDWKVDIFADEINSDGHVETPEPDQDYALVVYGVETLADCRAPVTPPAGLAAVPAGDNAISVSWTGTASGFKLLRAPGGCAGRFEMLTELAGSEQAFLDTPVSGSVTYGYVVRAVEACESEESACVEAITTGPCFMPPVFAGLASASGDGASSTCGIALAWPAASAWCGGPVLYNIYRSPDPVFTPSAANRIASCVAASPIIDQDGLGAARTYFYIVRAEDLSGAPGGPCGGLEETNTATRRANPNTLALFDFEDGFQGWTSLPGSPPAKTGYFIAGDPVGTTVSGEPAQPEDDHTPGGTQCLYTDQNLYGDAGINDVEGGEVTALSPLLDATGYSALHLDLWRWHYNKNLANDNDAGDYFAIDISNDDGQDWTNLEFLDFTVKANAWTERSFDLETILPLTDRMRLRVRSADGPDWMNLIESAVDDVAFTRVASCTASSSAPGVITGRPGPLLLVKSGGSVRLVWGPDCGAGTRYGVYRGDLSAGYVSLAPLAGLCDLAATSVDLPPGPGSHFFLVAPNDGVIEGSLGLTSAGLHRPQPGTVCYPRTQAVNPCAP